MESIFENLEDLNVQGSLEDIQNEILQAVEETGKPGKLTISLSYKIEGNGMVVVSTNLDKKVPIRQPRDTDMFMVRTPADTGYHYSLSATNPTKKNLGNAVDFSSKLKKKSGE